MLSAFVMLMAALGPVDDPTADQYVQCAYAALVKSNQTGLAEGDQKGWRARGMQYLNKGASLAHPGRVPTEADKKTLGKRVAGEMKAGLQGMDADDVDTYLGIVLQSCEN